MPKVQPIPTGNTGRKRSRTSRVSTSLAEINVVPLVDVMLVLLIIFMVAAPMMTQGMPVNLPRAANARNVSAKPVYVTVPVSFEKDHAILAERSRDVDEHALALNRAGANGRRQIDIDAALEQRRGHHEDDEQHQHHVDERDDIDLGERAGDAAASTPARSVSGCGLNFWHQVKFRSAMLRNSIAKSSMSDAKSFTRCA